MAIKVRIPATSANLGPGFDSIGLAVNRYNYVTIEEADGCQIISLDGAPVPTDETNLVYSTAKSLYELCGVPFKGLKIGQINNIPFARGLGSSSACIIGGLKGANRLLGNPLADDDLINLAADLEGHPDNSTPALTGGLVTAVLAGLVIIGGIKRIASVAERVVPAMVVLFLAFSCLLIIFNITKIPAALVTIVSSAFGLQAFGGGMFGAILIAMQMGLARGIFANEAGLGSAPIAAAAAQTKEPARQGLVSMTQTFIDSMIICSMTGLALVLTGTYNIGLEGAAVTTHAFQAGLPFLPPAVVSFVLMISLALFGFTTILGWDYYGERCLEYFSGRSKRAVMTYRWLYIFCLFIGPYMTVSAVWTIADIFNACMAVPNMIALFALSGVTAKELRNYFKRLDAANGDEEKMAPRPDDTEDWKSPKPQGAFGTVGVAQNFPCEE